MIEEISKKVEDLIQPIIQDIYDIVIGKKENYEEDFINKSLKAIENEYDNLFIEFKSGIIGNVVLSLQFYFYLDSYLFSKYMLYNNNKIYKTETIDLNDKIEFENKVKIFLNTYKAEVRQHKIKKILN